MKHWKIVRKYTDPTTGKTTTSDKEVSVTESRGLRQIRTGLWEKVSEFEDGNPAPQYTVVEMSPARKTSVQRIRDAKGE